MNPTEWLNFYEKKLGHKFCPFPNSNFEFDEEKGFCFWEQDGETLMIGDTCGDGRYFFNLLNTKAKELGCTRLKFGTYRKPNAFTRKYGFKITGYILEKEVL